MFENILLQKSSDANMHHLKRYIRLMQIWNNVQNTGYIENHHILPKHVFPEYKNLKHYPWNGIKLTTRQHIIAHYILMKAYPKSWKLAQSVLRIYGQFHVNNAQHTRIVAEARIQSSIRKKGWKKPPVSDSTKEKLSKNKKQFYSNPDNRIKQSEACRGTTGRIGNYHKPKSDQHRANLSASLKGRKINSFTNEHKEKISAALKNYSKTSEHLEKLRKSLSNQTRHVCPHCNIKTTAGNITRWHGKNCKSFPNSQT